MISQQQKKPTKGDLEKRLKCAILHIDKTRETKSIYFDDKGLRLTINDDGSRFSNGAHTHIFRNITVAGASRT